MDDFEHVGAYCTLRSEASPVMYHRKLPSSNEGIHTAVVSMQVYGQTVVLWRPRAGEVAALSDVCPHRGASLAMGSLVGTSSKDGRGKCVKCPYHGLEFDAAGTCEKKNIHTEPIKVGSARFYDRSLKGLHLTDALSIRCLE